MPARLLFLDRDGTLNRDCPNRKPRPGFILQALRRFAAQPEDCLFVGDSSTDREAARAAGVPFQWADRFFSRPIDRGIKAEDGTWFGIRQVPATEGALKLVAVERGEEIGSLALSMPGACEASADDTLGFSVRTRPDRPEVALILVATALEWAPAQRA